MSLYVHDFAPQWLDRGESADSWASSQEMCSRISPDCNSGPLPSWSGGEMVLGTPVLTRAAHAHTGNQDLSNFYEPSSPETGDFEIGAPRATAPYR